MGAGPGGTIGPMEPAARPGPHGRHVLVRRAGCGCLPALIAAAAIVAIAVSVGVALSRGGDAGSAAACGLFERSMAPGRGAELADYELFGALDEVRRLAEGADPAVREASEALLAASQSGRAAGIMAAAHAMTSACARAGHGP